MFSASPDYYSTLGVAASASSDEILKAYRKAVMRWHPDRNLTNIEESERRFKEVQEAYKVLSDPTQRAVYDSYGKSPFSGFDDGDEAAENAEEPFNPFPFGGFGRGRASGGFYGFRGKKGPEVKVTAPVDIETLVNGGSVKVKVSFADDCPDCEGMGVLNAAEECSRCDGDGYTDWGWCRRCGGSGYVDEVSCPTCRGRNKKKVEHQFQVNIQAGTPSTATLIARNKGPQGENGGPRGDVLCSLKVKPHKSAKLTGLTLTVDAKVDFVTALLGGETQVDVFGRLVQVPVPACCRAGRLLTIEGAGLLHPKTKERGDLKVRIVLEMPDGVRNLSREHKAILRSMFDAAANKRK